MMDKLCHQKLFKNSDFITKWMIFHWQVLNFTSCNILNMFPHYLTNVSTLATWACLYSNIHFLKEILENVPNLTEVYMDGNSLLHLICRSSIQSAEKANLVQMRYSHLITIPNKNGLLPLHVAIMNHNVNIFEELMSFTGLEINAVTKDKHLAPLHIAAHFGMDKHVEMLLNHLKINVNIVDLNGDTPLHHAVGRRHFTTFALLAKDKRCNRYITNKFGERAEDNLAAYITKCSIDDFSKFSQFCSMDIVNRNGNNPLHLCCMGVRDGFEKFRYLVDQHRHLLKNVNKIQNRPMHIAAKTNDKRFLEYVLKQNIYININVRGHRDRTPLHMACFKGYSDHVELLLHDYDTNINAEDADGNTPLHFASATGFYEIIKMIMAFPWCKTDMTNNQNQTAMDIAPKSVKIAINVDKCTVPDLKEMHDSCSDT